MTRRALAAAALSGLSALICEVIWAHPLRLIVGDTALALALVLSVFFAGMAVGSWWIGERTPQIRRPTRFFIALELALALFALIAGPLLFALQPIHFAVLRALGRWINLPLGMIEAGIVMLIPTALMGGTIPVLLRMVSPGDWDAEKTAAARLYAWNTLGAALGAVLAGVLLVPALGMLLSGVAAAACNAFAAVTMLGLPGTAPAGERQADADAPESISPALLGWLALGSGFVMLGLEVFWARDLSAILTNSSASFALLLSGVLLGLAIGAWIAARADFATRWAPLVVVQITLAFVIAAVAILAGGVLPALASVRHWFRVSGLTGGLALEVVVTMALTLIPSLLLGLNLPLIFAAWSRSRGIAGQRWGRLVALSTSGSIAGSLLTALALIPLLHMRGTAITLSLVSASLGLGLWRHVQRARWLPQTAVSLLLVLVLAAVILVPQSPPLAEGQTLIACSEGLGANVSVTESADGARTLLVDDRYVLGGTGGRMLEFRQALIPALLHPHPRRIFHLGMGTGHTAGALSVLPGLERLVTCENIPGVVRAAKRWFADTDLGLFENPHAEIVVADGRHWLSASSEKFDLIVIDNLLPWLAGTGHLFTREFYASLHRHLAPGGLVAVWIPLHQVDAQQIALIHRTLAAEFPTIQLWLARPELETSLGLFASDGPVSQGHLLGDARYTDPDLSAVLDAALIRGPEDVFAGLCGVNSIATDGSVATDNRPRLEEMALRTFYEDLALHPELYTSPAMQRNWALISDVRRRSTATVRLSLGVEEQSSPESSTPAESLWRRWRTQTTLAEGLLDLCRGDSRVAQLWLRAAADDRAAPFPPRLLEWLLVTLTRSAQWRAAADLGEQCQAIFELPPEDRIVWARSLINTGSPWRASRELKRVLDADPDNLPAALELIRALDILDRPSEARQLLEETSRRHPDDPQIQALMANRERRAPRAGER